MEYDSEWDTCISSQAWIKISMASMEIQGARGAEQVSCKRVLASPKLSGCCLTGVLCTGKSWLQSNAVALRYIVPIAVFQGKSTAFRTKQGLFVFISWYPDCEKKYKVRFFFIVLDLEGMHSMGYCMHPRVQFKVVALNAWPPVNEIRGLAVCAGVLCYLTSAT